MCILELTNHMIRVLQEAAMACLVSAREETGEIGSPLLTNTKLSLIDRPPATRQACRLGRCPAFRGWDLKKFWRMWDTRKQKVVLIVVPFPFSKLPVIDLVFFLFWFISLHFVVFSYKTTLDRVFDVATEVEYEIRFVARVPRITKWK